MARALRLAERGLFTTQPNPRVGCVIARDGSVVGEGFHQRAGEPHAEVHALRMAGAQARGATAYVTLEPCAHFGRTPPCADALMAAGIARVVVAAHDPFPQVDGRGIERLRAHGIAVESGLLEADALELNRGFFARVRRGRPWLRLKLACSLDGRTALADGSSKWITGDAARADVQRWRARSGAILSSVATVRRDDPQLTVRLSEPFAPPVRVIVAGRGALLQSARLWQDGAAANLLVVADDRAVDDVPEGVEVLKVPGESAGPNLHAMLNALAARDVNEVHTECGARLAGSLIDAGLVDELLLYQAPTLLGEAGLPLIAGWNLADLTRRLPMTLVDRVAVGADLRFRFRFDWESAR
ncbi:MAG: bifunctional diaminohydroxyphosphoribosylaminopyrimidine deaminase/5-amino-6-(5-phosphoribosylamino)uracil reductase RibD [Xanthomonadales bacterium]|nr:bifunctional diaminohydroxyphosphoribosylaminopyrimidine deaminase/5-amino-6-(5-phosphoribosylamino)uracil reductase RibD [Xanthomonadales bacterium]